MPGLKRAITEISLIVVGVSIALAGDAWLTNRAEEARTNLLLDSLEVEWSAELERLEAYVERADRAMVGVAETIKANKRDFSSMTSAEAGAILEQDLTGPIASGLGLLMLK